MNSVGKLFLSAIAAAAAIMITSMLMIGCKSSTEAPENQAYNSEATADIMAASLGTESGGAGVNFADVSLLLDKGNISGIIENSKGATPQSIDSSYDPVTGLHTLTITRSIDWGMFDFSALVTYTYTFFHADGSVSRYYQKGVTDKITMSIHKARSLDKGERLDAEDEANGTWTIDHIISGIPILNGSLNRTGKVAFKNKNNQDRSFDYDLTINFINDTIIKSDDKKHTYLQGTATSDFSANGSNGNSFTRHTDITFDGDGTATLLITRTSGDGETETHLIDVKIGKWLKKLK